MHQWLHPPTIRTSVISGVVRPSRRLTAVDDVVSSRWVLTPACPATHCHALGSTAAPPPLSGKCQITATPAFPHSPSKSPAVPCSLNSLNTASSIESHRRSSVSYCFRILYFSALVLSLLPRAGSPCYTIANLEAIEDRLYHSARALREFEFLNPTPAHPRRK